MKKLNSLLFLMFSVIFSFSQAPTWKIYNTSNSQIPWNKFKSMDFDAQGNLWGCYDNSGGSAHLTRFDGTTFTNYISSAWVNDVCAAAGGGVWFTTSNMELQKYDGTFHVYTNSLLSSPWMEPVYADLSGNVWIVNYSEKYVVKFDGTNWTKYDHTNSCIPDNFILDMVDHNGSIWMATPDSGLVKFGNTGCELYNTSNSMLPNNKIYALKKGKGDSLWFVCSGYLGYFTGTVWQLFQNTSLTTANSIEFDSKGNIWISNPDFTNGGVFKYDRQGWTVYSKSNSPIPTNQINDMKIDKNDHVWIATWGSGLVEMTPSTSSVQPQDEMKKAEIYPSCAADFIYLTIPENLSCTAEICDMAGKVMFWGTFLGPERQRLDVSAFTKGIYLLKLNCDDEVLTGKFVKQ